MMNLYQSKTYMNCLAGLSEALPARDGTFFVTGATGLIGSLLVDALLYADREAGRDFRIVAAGRSLARLENRFCGMHDRRLLFLEQDVCEPVRFDEGADYIVHAASNADPRSYAEYPAETVLTNVEGTSRMLDYCGRCRGRMVMLSTFEVYGSRGADEAFSEEDFGLIDPNRIRSGYPESKRCAEILVRSRHAENGTDARIARLSSIYGPTMLPSDNKAHAQFIRKALAGENIVLKSRGWQKRTYTYAADAVSAVLKILTDGKAGEAYNAANGGAVVTIAEVAAAAAALSGTKVVYELSDEEEARGFGKPQHCVLSTKKLEALGWKPTYPLEEGLKETLCILREAGEPEMP